MSELIDRQALDRAFTQLRFDSDGKLAHWGDRKDWCLHGSEVEKLISDAPTIPASPWHRVEEPPKEDGKYVAINVKTKWWYEASYENGNWKAVDLFGQRWVVIHPTHWMPIEPPKEGA